MKISELFAAGDRRLFSFEFFPPKTDAGGQALERTIRELAELSPAFVSVTYGAGRFDARPRPSSSCSGSSARRASTAMAHLTCVGAGQDEIGAMLDRLRRRRASRTSWCCAAIRRGPGAAYARPPGGFRYAAELVAFIRERVRPRSAWAAPCYPEGHVECRDLEHDLAHLKAKVDAGARLRRHPAVLRQPRLLRLRRARPRPPASTCRSSPGSCRFAPSPRSSA